MVTIEEFVERLCRLGADRGPRAFPRRLRDRQILMRSVLLQLDSGGTYTEQEINDALIRWNRAVAPAIRTDHVTLRRLLVDHGHLERTRDGCSYRVGFPPGSVAFDIEIFDLDLPATIAAYRDEQTRQRQERARTHKR
jgi:hypothetical protein